MVDMAMISGVAASLKAAQDIAKAMLTLRDTTLIQEKVIELQRIILAAQSDALAAQSEQFSLLEKIRTLETKMAQLEAWDVEKQKYALKQIAPGAFAYVLKAGASSGEAPHWLCTACYERKHKGHLQMQGQVGRNSVYKCAGCQSAVTVPWSTKPEG